MSRQNIRLCQLVPSAGRRYELREFAYLILARGDSIETATQMMMREKKIDKLIAGEVVMWVAGHSFAKRTGWKKKRIS